MEMPKHMLRVTHIERGDRLIEGGWFIRFMGEETPFMDMRSILKKLPHYCARWCKDVRWPDGKEGAWWLDDEMVTLHAAKFINLQQKIDAVEEVERQAAMDAEDYDFSEHEWPEDAKRRRDKEEQAEQKRQRHYEIYRQSLNTPPVFTFNPSSPHTPLEVHQALAVMGFTSLPTKQELKSTWRRLATSLHPDRQGDEIEFKRLNNANELLIRWIEQSERAEWSA